MTDDTNIGVTGLSTGFRITALSGFIILMALGVWQVQRLHWKLDLIARVDARVHAPAVDAPGPEQWAGIGDATDSYRPVHARGRFINDKTTYVQASTALGMGYWVMTPLHTDRGFTVLVNRGFVPAAHQEGIVTGHTDVHGLLRMSEPRGRWLRPNHPAQARWYSRDTAAIAAARGLDDTAPYFIDEDATKAEWPRAGLTVIHFANNHLQYALTWFGMALALVIGVFMAERQMRRPA